MRCTHLIAWIDRSSQNIWFAFYQISSFIEYYMYINKQYTMTNNDANGILLESSFNELFKDDFDTAFHEWKN